MSLVVEHDGKQIPLCEVVRIRRSGGVVVQDCDEYIGRAQNQGGWRLPASEFANPFTVKQYGLPEACRRYYEYVKAGPLYERLERLRGKTIGCWCEIDTDRDINERLSNPQCHGEVIMRLLLERSLAG